MNAAVGMSAGWERPAGRAPRGRRDRHMGPAARARFRPRHRRTGGQLFGRLGIRSRAEIGGVLPGDPNAPRPA